MERASSGASGSSSEDSDDPEMTALGILNEEIDVEETTGTESEACLQDQHDQSSNSEQKPLSSDNSASSKGLIEIKKEKVVESSLRQEVVPDSTGRQKVNDSDKEVPAEVLEENVECTTRDEIQRIKPDAGQSRSEESHSDKPEATLASGRSASSAEAHEACNLPNNPPATIPAANQPASATTQRKPHGPGQKEVPRIGVRSSDFLPKLKSFEDAFKASLEKLKSAVTRPKPRKIIRARSDSEPSTSSSGVKHLVEKDVTDSGKEKKATWEAEDKACVSLALGEKHQARSMIDESKSPKKEIKTDVELSDNEASDFRDVENFSSDSSSTIIDMDTATKESIEEEAAVQSLGRASSSLLDAKNNRPTKSEIKKADEAKSKLNPTSNTKMKNVTEDGKSSLTENMNAKNVTKQEKDSTVHDEQGRENIKRSSKDGQTGRQAHPSRSEEASRKRLQSHMSREGKAKVRERSKSDESQNALVKKPRINKHGIMLQPGTKLEAMDYSRKWYAARIVNVDETDNTLLIHFDGWNSRFDEWMKFNSDRLRPLARVSARRETAKEVKALGGYRVGDEVLARWSDCRYYPAKILGIKSNGSYRVLFYDGIEKVVMGINVRDMPDTLKAQHFFSNLENQFRALVNKKQKGWKDDDGKNKGRRFSKDSISGSRAGSPVQPPQKRRHSSAGQSPAPQPPKRSRQDSSRTQKVAPHKGQKIVQVPEPVHLPPMPTEDQTESLVSPTSSEASELMSALEHGMQDGKKRYREPLIFDKNTGLIRDRRRLVAPKELVIDLDHNKYKCDVPDCGKAFRKASLLEYHKKYYHINKPSASSTSTMTAAKNAVTRSRKRLSTSAIATSSSKMCRTESSDRLSAKVASRPQRASAPSVMTTSYKRSMLPLMLDSPPPKPSEADAPQSNHFLMVQSGREKTRRQLTTLRTETSAIQPEAQSMTQPTIQPQAPASEKVLEPENVASIVERSQKVSDTVTTTDEKQPTVKSEAASTTPSEQTEIPSERKVDPMQLVIKEEPVDQEKSYVSETKTQNSDTSEIIKDIPQKQVEGPSKVTEVAVSPKVLKRERRNKPHKKHKRHKARSRDRRSREQSRQERRLVAEHAKEQRLQQRQKKSLEGLEQKPEDVMEWTSKCVSPKTEGNPPHALGTEDTAAKQDMADSSATEESGPKEMIRCICRSQEEEGFMIQCEACFSWQHGRCVDLTEHTIPKQYLCSFCIYPENLRTHTRHHYDQEWFKTGQFPCLVEAQEPSDGIRNQTESMLKTHQLIADMLNVTEALDALQHKLEILKSDNHPDLKLWSYHWGLKDETTPRDYSLRSRQLENSVEETEHEQTHTETGALMESKNDSSIITEVIPAGSGIATGMNTGDLDVMETASLTQSVSNYGQKETHEVDTTTTGDSSSIEGAGVKLSAESDSLNLDVAATAVVESDSLMDVDCEKATESLGTTVEAKHLTQIVALASDNSQFGSDNSALMQPKLLHESAGTAFASGKPTIRNVDNTETSSEGSNRPMQSASTGEGDSNGAAQDVKPSGAPLHDGIANAAAEGSVAGIGENSSDDEPLVNYIRKASMPVPACVGGKLTEEIKKASESSQPNSTPSAAPTDPIQLLSPSSGGQVPTQICKLHLFNHIVCVEDELKQRMDYVEEQIEALELAFAQSSESKGTIYVSPDASQMKRTIGVLIEDLERVNKLVST